MIKIKKIIACITTLLGLALTSCGLTHTHTPIEIPGYEASCTQDGKKPSIQCSECQEVLEEGDVIPALGHDVISIPGVEATCTTSGKTEEKRCRRCDEIILESTTIDPKGHEPVVDEGVEPTETCDGHTAGEHCEECGEVLVEPTFLPADITGTDLWLDDFQEINGSFQLVVKSWNNSYSFSEHTKVNDKASFAVFDLDSRELEIDNIPLIHGDNKFHVIVTNGNLSETYAVNIHRNFTYIVCFKMGDGQKDIIQTVEEGEHAIAPEEIPSKAGHSFLSWSGIENEIHEDTVIEPIFSKNRINYNFDLNGGHFVYTIKVMSSNQKRVFVKFPVCVDKPFEYPKMEYQKTGTYAYKDEYFFSQYYTDANYKTKFDPTKINGSVTLYPEYYKESAGWIHFQLIDNELVTFTRKVTADSNGWIQIRINSFNECTISGKIKAWEGKDTSTVPDSTWSFTNRKATQSNDFRAKITLDAYREYSIRIEITSIKMPKTKYPVPAGTNFTKTSFYGNPISDLPLVEREGCVFSGWECGGELININAPTLENDSNLIAKREPDSNYCKAIWMNEDGTVLAESYVKKGQTPSYPYGEPEPIEISNTKFKEFTNWSPTLQAIYSDTVYTAEYVTRTICNTCLGSGVMSHKCGVCNGTGTHETTVTQTCYLCSGAGTVDAGTQKFECSACHGLGGVYNFTCNACGSTWRSGFGTKCWNCGSYSSKKQFIMTCTVCHGSGTTSESYTTTCTRCSGSGIISVRQNIKCEYCSGNGWILCNTCNGKGYK